MVVEGQALGSLGVIRSLGRAGYPVVAVASDPSAIGLRSRFGGKSLTCPDYEAPGFLTWLQRTIARQDIKAIVPSEGFLHAIRPVFDELAPLLPSDRDGNSVYASLSKFDLFARLEGLNLTEHLPPFTFVGEGFPSVTREQLEMLRFPVFAKFDSVHARRPADNIVLRLRDYDQFQTQVPSLLDTYRRGLVPRHL